MTEVSDSERRRNSGVQRQSVNLGTVTATSVGAFQDDQYTLTADKQLTEKNKLTARWFFSDNNASQPFGTGANNANSLPLRKVCGLEPLSKTGLDASLLQVTS